MLSPNIDIPVNSKQLNHSKTTTKFVLLIKINCSNFESSQNKNYSQYVNLKIKYVYFEVAL